jgi:hypothetical protein
MKVTELSDTLVRLEREGWTALCDGSSSEFYERTMTDDGLMVLANGAVMDRAAVVAALAESPPWARYEMDDVRVVPAGQRTACLVYRAKAFMDAGDEPAFDGVMSSVYVDDGDGWRLALYQQTRAT